MHALARTRRARFDSPAHHTSARADRPHNGICIPIHKYLHSLFVFIFTIISTAHALLTVNMHTYIYIYIVNTNVFCRDQTVASL